MSIVRLKLARGMAVFRDYVPVAADAADFSKLNLIYGFNGSGKTTLSRFFASLERGELCAHLPVGGRFEIDLSDGSSAGSEAGVDRLKGQLAVFNSDFVEENFRWSDGLANPVFYIGREQADLGRELEATENELVQAQAAAASAATSLSQHESRFTAFKRDTARNILQQTYTANYRAPTLEADYAKAVYGVDHVLDEDKQKDLTRVVLQDEPPAALERLSDADYAATSFPTLFSAQATCLSQTVGSLVLDDLKAHETMIRWVGEGLAYHDAAHLSTCLFCANPIGDARMAALKASVDDRFDRLIADTQDTLRAVEELQTTLATAKSNLPSPKDLFPDKSAAYSKAVQVYSEAQARVVGGLQLAGTALKTKLTKPNTVVEVPALSKAASRLSAEVAAAVFNVNRVIDQHNKAQQAFAQTQTDAKAALRANLLAASDIQYRELADRHDGLKLTAETAAAKAKGLLEKADHLRQQVQQHGPAADAINTLIKSYLRHGELEIEAVPDGFHIRRHGRQIFGGISEGEKTAITFCYFLSSLAANGRKIEDLIIVIDDPVSSLDTKAMNYAFNLVRNYAAQAKQAFILTHNVQFMNECKKWLKRKKADGNASIAIIDLKQSEDGVRSSRLQEMPKLLLDFDSEYHYLFKFVLGFLHKRDDHYDYTYLVPNAMRKVMEVFLSFKLPTAGDIAQKLDQLVDADTGLDPIRLRALNRLVQVESHGDNLDDLVSLSSMTLEETHECAAVLMEMMEALDEQHYTRLCGMCSS